MIVDFLVDSPWVFLTIVAALSLCIGSFLNVVIYRVPLMLKHDWTEQCQVFLEQKEQEAPQPVTLSTPRSHCPSCKKNIPFWANIPLFGYILLRGKCHECKKPISFRYPLIEFITAVASLYVAASFGVSWLTLAALVFTWVSIALVVIDINEQLLPDNIILPMVWIGLLLSLTGMFSDVQSSILGATGGYLVFWLVAWLFKKIRGISGMGHGDFKLLAMIGAWLGWQVLPLVIIISSLLGTIGSIITLVLKRYHYETPLPFGPYLAIAGWVAMFFGADILSWYWSFVY